MRTSLLFISIILCFFSIAPAGAYAADVLIQNQSPQVLTAAHQLSIENTRNILLENKLAALQQQTIIKITYVTDDLLKRAELNVNLAKADLAGSALAITNVQSEISLNQADINEISNQLRSPLPSDSTDENKQAELANQLAIQQHLHHILGQRIKVLQKTQNLAQQALQVALEWQAQLQTIYQQQQQQQRQKALDQLAITLQNEQQSWLQRLAELNKQLQTSGSYGLLTSATYTNLEIGILEAEERSNLTQVQLSIAKLRNNLENLGVAAGQQYSLANLNNFKQQTDDIAAQLNELKKVLRNKINLLKQRSQLILKGLQDGVITDTDGNNNLSILYSLTANYQKQLDSAEMLLLNTQQEQTTIKHQLNEQIASRQGLPGFNSQAWELLGQRLVEVPGLTLQALQNSQKSLLSTVYTANVWQQLGWGIYLLVWAAVWYWLRRYLIIGTSQFAKHKQSELSSNLFFACLLILTRFLPGLMLIGLLISAPLVLGIPLQTFTFISSVSLIIFSFSVIRGFAHILLLENTTDESGHDVQLYHRLKWALLLGGIITVATAIAHQLPVAFNVQDLFDRFFMLFLLVVALVLFRAWKIILTLLKPYLEHKRPYLRQVVRLLSLLIPLTILSNALVGLIGYVVLAWSIAAYQGLLLVVLTGFIIARGILGELMNLIAAKMIRHLRNGWLWREALLKPLHQILKIAVFIGAIAVLFNLYGWGEQSWPVIKLKEFASLRLLSIAGSVITPISLLELFFLIAFLVWAARWTREFTYRWLFARTKDLGLRNSLAVFSQYLIVIIGILVTLKVMGINLTALTVVASAFAFGVGLGLRDLANNFMCGILLLIERPVHVGDYVTMANMDGEVVHIGARAITIVTGDHQELLVPNAVAFSQPFVNWTHRDNIVRVHIAIKTARLDDPHRVQTIILDVLKSMPRILTNPPPNVYLQEMSEMLLKFDFEYYVDLRAIPSRSVVKSQVLLALWDRFQAEGIHAPDYPHEVLLLNQQGKED